MTVTALRVTYLIFNATTEHSARPAWWKEGELGCPKRGRPECSVLNLPLLILEQVHG